MPLTREQLDRIMDQYASIEANFSGGPKPRRGEEIFSRPGPRTWEEYIGQDRAKAQLKAAIASAKARGTRLDHILIAAGQYGAGKTALARLLAAEMGVGIVEISGVVDVKAARPILKGMEAGDILFIDEIHTMVSSGKSKAEWLLHLLEDGRLLTDRGAEPMPNITVVAATTDAGKLPETILSRFPTCPVLDGATLGQAAEICIGMAKSLGFGTEHAALSTTTAVRVAECCSRNPRDMRQFLTVLRDAAYGSLAPVDDEGDHDLTVALQWSGRTEDGLTQAAQDYLSVMLVDFDGKAGEKTIAASLGEPGPMRHVEKALIQKGLIAITPGGRVLTDRGVERTGRLLDGASE